MAIKRIVTEELVSPAVLAGHIETYWKNQENGLVVGGGNSFFAYEPIRTWFMNHKIVISDAEIVDAHREFFKDWIKTAVGVMQVNVLHAGLDDRDRFHIYFIMNPIPSIRIHCMPTIDDAGVVSPDMMKGTDSLILGTKVPPSRELFQPGERIGGSTDYGIKKN